MTVTTMPVRHDILTPADRPAGPSIRFRPPRSAGLRSLPAARLPELAADIRGFLIEKVCAAGGHLGPNLGVVELTIALHRVFRTPHDVLLFDTGHQAYVHKVLTGRAAGFGGLRKRGGMSGYPCRTESAHDVIENSHASTALSYADGFAKGFNLTGERGRHVVAVVGDGAIAGGMCWEAMNNIGSAPDRPVIVVLNDNGRSYSPTVGSLSEHLATIRQQSRRQGQTPDGNLFEALGFAYLGPVDGHDIPALEQALRRAARMRRPVVVHAITEKGKGYPHAEAHDEDRMHAVGVIDHRAGQPTSRSVLDAGLRRRAHRHRHRAS